MPPFSGCKDLSFSKRHFLFAKVLNGRKLHQSKLQSLINIHWKLKGRIYVVFQFNDSFLIYFQSLEDLNYIHSHNVWLLQGFSIGLFKWKQGVSLSNSHTSHLYVWMQIHGLPLNQCNLETARFIGNQLGSFISFDEGSLSIGHGLRLQVKLSSSSLSYTKLCSSRLFGSGKSNVSLVLEQIGRVCSSCMSFGHVARHCKESSNLKHELLISVVGYRSASVQYDRFSGNYSSTAQMTGIQITQKNLELKEFRCLKRKDWSYSFESINRMCKRKKIHSVRDPCPHFVEINQLIAPSCKSCDIDQPPQKLKKRLFGSHVFNEASLGVVLPHPKKKITTCEIHVDVEPLSRKVEIFNQIQIVREKRKRYWGEIIVFPPPFKKRKRFRVLEHSTPSCEYICDDFHFQHNKVHNCFSGKRPWNDIHAQCLGSSGACAKKLRVSG